MLSFNEYQSKSGETRLETASTNYLYLNYAAEAGEALGHYAKGIRDGFPLDFQQKIKKELGDGLWHIAQIAEDNGFTLEDIAQSNLDKLAARAANNTLKGSGDDR